MSELQLFNHKEFGDIRAFMKEGQPWVVGKDVCIAFGDTNHRRSLSRLDSEDKGVHEITDSMGRYQTVVIINESGFYSLLFNMQPQKANNDGVSDAYPIEVQRRIERLKLFKRWVLCA